MLLTHPNMDFKLMRLPAKIIATGILSLYSISSIADTVKFQTPACTTDDSLDEFTRYIIDGDENGMMQLIQAGECTVLQEGDIVSVASRGFSTTTIRYQGVKLLVPSEAIKPK